MSKTSKVVRLINSSKTVVGFEIKPGRLSVAEAMQVARTLLEEIDALKAKNRRRTASQQTVSCIGRVIRRPAM